MKKINFLLLLFVSNFVFSSFAREDVVIDDFESGNQGWLPVNEGWVNFEIVDNPHKDIVNSSAKVMKITRYAQTESWAGIILRDKIALAFGALPGQYRYVHVKIFKTASGNAGFKLEKDTGTDAFIASGNYSPSGQWQEIVFDMGGAAGATYDDYFIMPDRTENLSTDIIIYIDEIVVKTDTEAWKKFELPGTFRQVWADEFNGSSYDRNIWIADVGRGPNNDGWGNWEEQYYTDSSNNIFTRDGNLVLKAIKENYQSCQYTSGKLKSQGKKAIKYGRVEARFKLPEGRGTWSAIWMMPQSNVYGEWPNSGEIDIMEFVGYDAGKVYGTVHRGAGSGSDGYQNHTDIAGKTDDFHTVRIDWEPGYIKWYLNNQLFHTCDNAFTGSVQWPFDREFYIILNFAVGGTWGGAQGVAGDIWPQEFLIDYVRVYQKSTEDVTDIKPAETVESPSVRIYLHKQILHVDSPAAERIYIYSLTGTLLYRLEKPAGKTSFVINRPCGSTRSQVLIVRGSSGWAEKLTY